jgi:ComF family protein
MSFYMPFTDILSDFLGLFFPRICASCNDNLFRNEKLLCTRCLYELPKTNYQNDPENEVAQMFWGRVPVKHAMAYCYFHKKGHLQTLLHKLKYKGQKEIGYELGKMMGYDLLNSSFSEIDIIIPVPLHNSKLRKRGYNQSECIANGISAIMNAPVDHASLSRAIANPTQTKKHRYDRWSNVEGIFTLANSEKITNKHILLVDDVVTTGATLEACVTALLRAENVQVSIAALGKA